MDEEYVPYKQALELEQLGFDEYCMEACYYEWKNKGVTHILLHTPDSYDSHDGVKAPTFSQAFRWFREKHKIISVIDFHCDGDDWEDVVHEVRISEFEHFKTHDSFVESEYKTYEEAELACLKQLIEIVKNK
jgi:hypothetical protein